MELVFYLVMGLYLQMLPFTILVLSVAGMAISFYKHDIKPVLYSLLVALPVNMVVVWVYLVNFAHFG